METWFQGAETKIFRGLAAFLGCGAWGGSEGIGARLARTRVVEAACDAALGDGVAVSGGEGAVLPKMTQNLDNQTNPSRISYQVNNQIGWICM